jgi:hypothetical protein
MVKTVGFLCPTICETMQPLSKEFQMLLVDDLVTAFESRFKVLNRAQTPMDCYVEIASVIEHQLV